MAGTSADDEVTASSRKLGIALPAVAAACDEICVLGYVDTPQRLQAMLASYARVLGPDAKFSVALRPLLPDCRSEENLHEKVAAVLDSPARGHGLLSLRHDAAEPARLDPACPGGAKARQQRSHRESPVDRRRRTCRHPGVAGAAAPRTASRRRAPTRGDARRRELPCREPAGGQRRRLDAAVPRRGSRGAQRLHSVGRTRCLQRLAAADRALRGRVRQHPHGPARVPVRTGGRRAARGGGFVEPCGRLVRTQRGPQPAPGDGVPDRLPAGGQFLRLVQGFVRAAGLSLCLRHLRAPHGVRDAADRLALPDRRVAVRTGRGARTVRIAATARQRGVQARAGRLAERPRLRNALWLRARGEAGAARRCRALGGRLRNLRQHAGLLVARVGAPGAGLLAAGRLRSRPCRRRAPAAGCPRQAAPPVDWGPRRHEHAIPAPLVSPAVHFPPIRFFTRLFHAQTFPAFRAGACCRCARPAGAGRISGEADPADRAFGARRCARRADAGAGPAAVAADGRAHRDRQQAGRLLHDRHHGTGARRSRRLHAGLRQCGFAGHQPVAAAQRALRRRQAT